MVFLDHENADMTATTRRIPPNIAAGNLIGPPVEATYTGTGTLTYTLGGTDASKFTIDSGTGQ